MDFPLLIFSDLDGTLLDHHTYSFQGAVEALQRLRQLSIPLILTSSKTRREIQQLQQQLGLNEAFISENGGGIFFPRDYPVMKCETCRDFAGYRAVLFGRSYADIRTMFAGFRKKYALQGFGDMSINEIMEVTGLDRESALFAAERDFSEPFLFVKESRPEELSEEAAAHDLTVTKGGRFYHLMAAGQDKGRAVRETVKLFRNNISDRIITVGLGDAPNDYPMLRAVDVPVLIPGPDGRYAEMKITGLRKAPFPGSRGWGIIIADILAETAGQRQSRREKNG
jgi:mannosyl-3-phosphoglycerate phosphatase